MNVTPDKITVLQSNEVFVFGANERGIHRAGAALQAYKYFGAIMNQGFGLQGSSFGIPTKDKYIKTLPLNKIKVYVQMAEAMFIAYPMLNFLVTKIGCGLADYTPTDIAPLFTVSYQLPNVYMPKEFIEIIDISKK